MIHTVPFILMIKSFMTPPQTPIFFAISEHLEPVFFSSLVDAFISRSLTPPPHFEICDLSDDKNHDDSSNELLPPAPPPLRYILFSTLISSHLMINSHFSLDTCQHDILLSIFNFKFIKSTFLHALRRKHTSDSKPYLRG